MKILLAGALLALPAVAISGPHCNEKPRPVLLQPGLHIDVVYCGATPEIATTIEQEPAHSDGHFYTLIAHKIERKGEDSAAQVLIYKPNGERGVPAHDFDSLSANILKAGSIDSADHSGWVTEKDFRLDQTGHEWLEARQIVMRKPHKDARAAEQRGENSGTQWVYYRIIRDTRHELFYVLYQRDDEGPASQENRFFNSFRVDPESFPVDALGPGAHLPAPYPNP
jgi:hypothetical protein